MPCAERGINRLKGVESCLGCGEHLCKKCFGGNEYCIKCYSAETFEAERKKRSGLLSEPFEGTSLDSGDWKGIVVGFGIGLLGLFGYSKLRK